MSEPSKRPSLLARHSVHRWIPNSLIILMIVFFLVPFAMRGARMALQGMRNDVKDWLPSDFQETVELEWFGRHFVGERFVLLTWPGFTEDSPKARLLIDKLEKETVPADLDDVEPTTPASGNLAADEATEDGATDDSAPADAVASNADSSAPIDASPTVEGSLAENSENTDSSVSEPSTPEASDKSNDAVSADRFAMDRELERARRFGDRYGLFAGQDFLNWGGLDEKWLESESGAWYYVLPDGKVYRWDGKQNVIGWIGRGLKRASGRYELEGEHVATFGDTLNLPDDSQNPVYGDTRRLTARLFKTIQTGPELLEQLASEGGPLWPFGDVAEEFKPIKARRDALERLTGSMFAPAVPAGFTWRVEDFKALLPESTLEAMPEGWEDRYREFVRDLVETRYQGDREKLIAASSSAQAEHWYAAFDELGVAEPPRQTALIVTLSEVGKRNLSRVLGRGLFGAPQGKLLELAAESGITPPPSPPMAPPPFNWAAKNAPIPEPALRMGGPPVDNVAIDEEGRITQVRLIGYSVFLGLFLAYLCFRSAKVTIMIFFVGGISAVSAIGFVWWFGSSLDAVLLSMPPLVYVLGLSGAVHIVNYYRDAVEDKGVEGAPERALRHGWWPCTLASFTTAIGLLSLYTSNIVPIRKFGLFAAIGVMSTLVVLFLYLPAALQTFVPKFKPRTNLPDGDDWLTRAWASVGMWIVRHYKPVTAVGLLVLFGVGYGTTKINTSVQLLKLFDGESKIIKDYEWLEANVGKLVPMELVVRVSPDMVRPAREELAESGTAAAHRQRFQLSFLERAELTARVQEVVEKEFGEQGQGVVGRAMSAVTLMPQLPPPAGASAFGRDYLERTKFLKDMEASRAELMSSDFLRLDEDLEHEGSELWRISLRVGALNDVDYGLFVHELKDAIEPVMAAYRYRDQILHGIDEKRGGEGFWKTADHGIPRVLVLGAADPDEVTTAEAATEEASSEKLADENATAKADNATGSQAEQVAANRAEPSAHSIEQSHIFAKTLKDLLVNASFRKTTWHDPVTKPVREVAADDEQWGKAIEAFDAVVVMDDHADYDLDFIKQHASVFVDARQHRYNFDAGMPTANQEDRPIHTVYTGLVPVVYKAQRTLLISLIESIGWAFVLIAAVMTMLLNPGKTWRDSLRPKNLALSLGAGLSSMLPNVFPVALIFGLMGYMGRRVDIGSMMTASVAMGVAVDDTIHFLTWYRDGIRMGLRRKDAIVLAYKRCAAAMTQTTLIGGLGLSVFALSTFTPTQQFGTLMLALLAAALVGDLLFLPAILAGPLGKFFTPEREEDEPSSGPTPSAANSAEATESALATTSPDNGANADGKVTPGEERRETVSMAEPRRVDARRRVAAPADSPNGDEGEHREPATSITDTGAEDDSEADQTARQQQTPAASLGGSNGQPPKGKPGQGPHISHADRAAQRPQFTRRDEAH